MTISKYYARLHEEMKRIQTLYREARVLGQSKREGALLDEFYELLFNDYTSTRELRNATQELAEKVGDSGCRKALEDFAKSLDSSANEKARKLNELVFAILGAH